MVGVEIACDLTERLSSGMLGLDALHDVAGHGLWSAEGHYARAA